MYRSGIDDNWIREIHKPLVDTRSNLTFCGALEQIYDYISYNWNETTKKKRDNEFNNIILPNIENHNEKTIDVFCKTFLHNIAAINYTILHLKDSFSYLCLDSAFFSRKLSPVKLNM